MLNLHSKKRQKRERKGAKEIFYSLKYSDKDLFSLLGIMKKNSAYVISQNEMCALARAYKK
jgi:hypothetical protein